MKAIKRKITSILETVEGTGAYFCSGKTDQILPGIYIENFGELTFPFDETAYNALLSNTQQAPFGKGSKTVVDTSVRSSREIDAPQIKILNPNWQKKIDAILKSIKKELGIENKKIEASLYKLLLYKKGDFFLPHKDSEKEKGMFGTLLIGLPAKHTGGEIAIEFNGQKETIKFAKTIEQYQMPYTAFFADCLHEIKPVTFGYRLCLVYNLIQTDTEKIIQSPSYGKQVEDLSKLFTIAKPELEHQLLPILLEHQYTPENFSLNYLKPEDLLRTTTVIEAAKKAGYHAKLALLTCYQSGDLEGDFDQYGAYTGGGDMGEVHESYLEIAHWVVDDRPNFGKVGIDKDNFVANYQLADGEPDETQEDTYTGNWGMTVEYWYHYGAVVIWPVEEQINLINDSATATKMEWLNYYTKHLNANGNKQLVKDLLIDFANINADQKFYNIDKIDFNEILQVYIKLDDESFVLEATSLNTLCNLFHLFDVSELLELLKKYPTLFEPLFLYVGNSTELQKLDLLLQLLLKSKTKLPKLFNKEGIAQIKLLPNYLNTDKIYKKTHQNNAVHILRSVIYLSANIKEEDWHTKTANLFTKVDLFNRDYTNKVLADTLLAEEIKATDSLFTLRLLQFCELHFKLKTAEKPQPPADWAMEVPKSENLFVKNRWDVIRTFLESPVAQTYDYIAVKVLRVEMENTIKHARIDLKLTTIRKGSPHTLRITKTQATYKNKLKKWEEDVELLDRLKVKIG